MGEAKAYWTSLVHNGVFLPPAPKYQGLTVGLQGRNYRLSERAEEMALAWARIMNSKRAQDAVFRANFFRDFVKSFPPALRPRTLDDIDFSEVRKALLRERRAKRLEKASLEQRRLARNELKQHYAYAYIDGRRVEIANWAVEPPGFYLGRGDHPLRGRWKSRVRPGDVTLNLSADAKIPKGRWGRIVHNPGAMWIAKWRDPLTRRMKYVWLHEGSSIRQSKDKEKYDNALKMMSRIERIRRKIARAMHSRNREIREVATACYLIDKLGMRVGDEKEADEADTVGATTLRVEHVAIKPSSIEFRFLGKDSVEWHKSLKIWQTDPQFLKNLNSFIKGRKPERQLFRTVSSAKVNKFLGNLAPGLTAKVFRTYHATAVVNTFLKKNAKKAKRGSHDYKIYIGRLANLEAAKLCNHKRTVPRSYRKSLRRKEEKLKNLEETIKTATGHRGRKLRQFNKLRLEVGLLKSARDYNLTTSLKNYIDPRIYKAWADYAGIDWRELYPKSLQKKFAWANRYKWELDLPLPRSRVQTPEPGAPPASSAELVDGSHAVGQEK